MLRAASEGGADAREFAAAPKIGNRCRVMLGVYDGCRRGDQASEILENGESANRLAFEEGLQHQRRSGRILGNQIADRLKQSSVQRLVEIGRRHQRRDLVIACVRDQQGAKQSLLQLDIVREIREKFRHRPFAGCAARHGAPPVFGRGP